MWQEVREQGLFITIQSACNVLIEPLTNLERAATFKQTLSFFLPHAIN